MNRMNTTTRTRQQEKYIDVLNVLKKQYHNNNRIQWSNATDNWSIKWHEYISETIGSKLPIAIPLK